MNKKDWFIRVPGAFLDEGHLRLMGGGLSVYLWLLGRQDRVTATVKTKIPVIADELGKSEKQVRRWISDLHKGGYIGVERHQYHVRIFILELPEIEGNRLDKNVHPETTPDWTKMSTLRQPDWTYMSLRLDKNVHPLNRKFVPESCSSLKEGGRETENNLPSPVDDFLKFCQSSHRAIHGVGLVLGPGDGAAVERFVRNPGVGNSRHDFKLLRVAWVLFQRDNANWLRGKSRTLALFFNPKILPVQDYLVPAKNRMDAPAKRRMASGRAPDSPKELIEAQEFTPDPQVEKFWTRCLDHLQANLIETNFNQFFSALVPVELTDKVITLAAPNKLHRKILSDNYRPAIQAAMATVDDVKREIRFQVCPPCPITGGAQIPTRKETQHA